ncbi:MAG: glycosyltransferase [Candidatus Geothermincolia bacterium]
MKLAVIGPTYPIRGGISHYTTLMVKHLRARHEVLFISYSKQYPAMLFPGRTQIDDSSDRIETESEALISFANPLSWRRAARRIADESPDVLVFSWVNPALAVQFRAISALVKRRSPGTRVVFWCHNVTGHESHALDALLTRLAFKHGDEFIVHGEEIKKNFLAVRPGARVAVTDHPVYDVFAEHSMTREEARDRLGLAGDAPVVLYFGFVRQYKGLSYLLQAIPEARESLPGLHLLVVGEFWDDAADYLREMRELGIEQCVTVRDSYVPNEEVALYFCAADIVALPYVSASASGIIQIAYGFDKPVVTTRVGSLPEVVEDGSTGYLVEPADHAALAGAINDFFTNDRREEFTRNVSEYRARFSWERFVEQVDEILKP